jgi:hypothetical protein
MLKADKKPGMLVIPGFFAVYSAYLNFERGGLMQHLKRALFGAFVGIVGGPLAGGLLGFVLMGLNWLIYGWTQQWSSAELAEIGPFAIAFAALIAPLCGSVGGIVGTIVGIFDRGFGSLLNAAGFGGVFGSIAGVLVLPALFGNIQEDLTGVIVTVLTLTTVGAGVAWATKKWSKQWGEE